MSACVSESSYTILFISAIVVTVLMLVGSAYFYDNFNKADTNRLTEENARMAKNISMISIIISVIAIALLFILFFGFSKRLVGVYATLPSAPQYQSPLNIPSQFI